MTASLYQMVCQTARKATLYRSAADALEWDERTAMPLAAGGYRAEQVSELRSAAHELLTSSRYGDALQELYRRRSADTPHQPEVATVLQLYRDYQRDRKLPTDLVSRMSAATVRGQQVWDQARKNDSFKSFAPVLEQIISLKREAGGRMAEGTEKSVYEALMDEYEPDARVSALAPVFADLKDRLVRLIDDIRGADKQPDVGLLRRPFPMVAQREFSRDVAGWVGFDFRRGRLDETSHPFCTTLGPNDCRILTRFEERWFPGGLYGTLHEAGHGMYEQGLPEDWFGLPPGSYVSLGIHESQSRLWENQVGRSRAFWQWLYPRAVERFPDRLGDVAIDDLHFAINQISPSLIRVEADEATYNLHILIRFELEQALIGDELAVDDLPDAWNARYRECLGIESPNQADGVLQDVHWSAGLFGYFPTYTLGNLAAAQFFDAAQAQLGDFTDAFAAGEFSGLLNWLRENIHRHGRRFSGAELIENATGHALSADHLMDYLESKLRPLYEI